MRSTNKFSGKIYISIKDFEIRIWKPMFSAKFSWAEKEKYLFIFHENKQKQLLGNKVATRMVDK